MPTSGPDLSLEVEFGKNTVTILYQKFYVHAAWLRVQSTNPPTGVLETAEELYRFEFLHFLELNVGNEHSS